MSEGIFTTHHIHIGDIKSFDLVPFGDVHLDSTMCDRDRWRSFNSRYGKAKNTWFVGMGDYNDFASTSERQAIRQGKLHGQSDGKLDRLVMKDIEAFVKDISYMKGRLIGLIEGNHTWEFRDGKTSTQLMCEMLECKYLGDLSFIRISCNPKGKSNSRGKIDILASHGKGGGKLVGSTFNKVEDMSRIIPQADIYLMGHDHKKGAVSSSSIEFNDGGNGLIMKQKRQWYGRTGSFLKGYEENEPSYIVDMLARPADLGTIRFECSFRRQSKTIDGIKTEAMIKDIHCWS